MAFVITGAKIITLLGFGAVLSESVRRFLNFTKSLINSEMTIENGETNSENDWFLVDENNDNPIQYINCVDSVAMNVESFKEIIEYALDFERKSFENSYDEFKYNCEQLTKILDSSEPYSKSMKINETEKLTNITELVACLPIEGTALREMIELAIVKLDSMGVTPTKSKIVESDTTDFFTIMIWGSGDNILVSPCYMSIAKESVCKGTLVSEERSFYYRAEYRRQTFTLSKFAIKEISQNIKWRKIISSDDCVNPSTSSSSAKFSKSV